MPRLAKKWLRGPVSEKAERREAQAARGAPCILVRVDEHFAKLRSFQLGKRLFAEGEAVEVEDLEARQVALLEDDAGVLQIGELHLAGGDVAVHVVGLGCVAQRACRKVHALVSFGGEHPAFAVVATQRILPQVAQRCLLQVVQLNIKHLGRIAADGPEARVVAHLQRGEGGADGALPDDAARAVAPIDGDDAQSLACEADEEAVVVLPYQAVVAIEHPRREVGEEQVCAAVGLDKHHVGMADDGLHVHDVVVLETAGVGGGEDLQVAMAIESVETTFGTNPHVAIGTLAQSVYLTAGEIGLDTQEVGCGQVMISIGRCEVANRLDGDKGEKKQEAIDDAAWSELAHQFFGMCSHKTGQC